MLVKDVPAASPRSGNATGNVLQPLVTDLIALSLSAKHVHWNVVGARFLPIHEHLDALDADLRSWTDTLAERIRALGVAAEGQAASVAQATAIDSLTGGTLGDVQAIDHITHQLDGLAQRFRAAVPALEQDLASQDFVIGVLQGLEKQLWMFRALGA